MHLIPRDIEPVLVPSDQWLQKIAAEHSTNLFTTHNKQKAVDAMRACILAEIERKKVNYKISEDLT